jgi:hypothetical protein
MALDVEAAHLVPEAEREIRPGSRVAAVQREMPAATAAGGPHGTLHARLEVGVVIALRIVSSASIM